MKAITVFLLTVFIALSACKNGSSSNTVDNDKPIDIEFIKQGELRLIQNDSILKIIEVEFAENESQRAIGLMNRSHMEENQGMLFIFQKENHTGFWMKDTRIPLDIIFIGADSTVINVQKNAKPFDEHNYSAKSPYWYVLELNGGMSDKWGIVEGETKINWTKN